MFVVQLGVAMNAAGQTVHSVQESLTRVAHAYGAPAAAISAFPTFLMVAMGSGEPATLELTSVAATPRLDQISALDRLVHEAERGVISPAEGIRRLATIGEMPPRFRRWQSVAGYAVLATGVCLVLKPSPRDVAAAAVLGAVVGVLRSLGKNTPPLYILRPLVAAFTVSVLSALAVRNGLTDAGLRAIVASLIVFLPGAALTTAVLELAAGQMISGSSRFVSGVMQLAMLSFGIIAGVQAAGVPTAVVFARPPDVLGPWTPWLGVLIFALGVMVANSAPPGSFPSLLIVLYSAWGGQVVGNALFGGYVSAFVGAVVMTVVAAWVTRLPSAMPQHASFLPGFWLLVPGALGLIGFTTFASDTTAAGTNDLVATAVSLFAVAVGVLCGTLLLAWQAATKRAVSGATKSMGGSHLRFSRRRREWPDNGPPDNGPPDRTDGNS
jgi:uncharacterized membrane protein YjjP (DUF1212 family)